MTICHHQAVKIIDGKTVTLFTNCRESLKTFSEKQSYITNWLKKEVLFVNLKSLIGMPLNTELLIGLCTFFRPVFLQ